MGLQQFSGDPNPIEPSCIVEGSKAVLVQSINLLLCATLQTYI